MSGILVLDPGGPERLVNAARPVAAAGQRSRLRQRKGGVVDIALGCEPLGDRFEIGRRAIVPAALADLAAKVGTQPGAGRREPADISQRQLVEFIGAERWPRPSCLPTSG